MDIVGDFYNKIPKPWNKEICRDRYVRGGDNITLNKIAEMSGNSIFVVQRWSIAAFNKDRGNKSWRQQRKDYADEIVRQANEAARDKVEALAENLAAIAHSIYTIHEQEIKIAKKYMAMEIEYLNKMDSIPDEEKASFLKILSAIGDNASKRVTRATTAITKTTGLSLYIDPNAAHAKLRDLGYEVIIPDSESEN